jgi:hypothetical protein
MLQNRVSPEGNIIKTPARGSWMGNRGIIHNGKQQIVRPYQIRAWIICRLEFKGRTLPVMVDKHNTQLFFLDEATALSAGHRPCAACRREDYNRFKELWLKGNPQYGFDKRTSIQQIDTVLQEQRIADDKSKITYKEKLNSLPDGVFVLFNDHPHLVYQRQLYSWTPSGYEQPFIANQAIKIPVLTPESTVSAIKMGYVPQIAI